MAAKFGTSGLRGLATELVGDPATGHTRAFLRHLKAKRLIKAGDAVCIGEDLRASSPALRANVEDAIAAEGLTALSYGAVPTPALAFEAMKARRAAVMITGSHIPADRNGLKFYRPDGEISKADEKAIVRGLARLKPQRGDVISRSAQARHFAARLQVLAKACPLKGLRVGVYQHSTTARDLLVETLQAAGAEVMGLGRSRQFIPVDTEAVSDETRQKLKQWAARHKLDALVSADGDGDRPLVADEHGLVLRGDLVGLITARFLKALVVVTPITSNSGLDRHLPQATRRTKVGSPFVIAAMEKARRARRRGIAGFEANGGFFTASPFRLGRAVLAPLPTRDCFLPILAVLAAARRARQPLSVFAAGFALPVALAGRVENYALERSAGLMARLAEAKACQAFFASLGHLRRINRLDGLRVTLADGSVVHLRPSGNAPEFRCYVEAATQEKAEALLVRALGLVSSA